MPDWTCTYTIYVGITAANEDKANERLLEIQSMIQIVKEVDNKGDWRIFNPQWLGDTEFGEMEVEEA